jgi:F1F0 ATPase subunit 2
MISWSLGAAFAGGLVLGLVNFSLLFATTARLLEAKRPMMLATGSFFGRIAVITACLYLLAGGHGGKLVAALAGLLLARGFFLRRAGCNNKAAPVLTRRAEQA